MSRLLPETVVIGLFPGRCWMRRGGRDVECEAGTGPQELLQALEALLTAQVKPIGRRSHVQILVSDSLAAIALLPWQEQLSSQAELQAYAHACFEQQGGALDEGWVLQTAYRRFRANGMAYALPQAWLVQLLGILAQRSLRLQSVLPVSVAAYWRARKVRAPGRELVLLQEAQRLTAMMYDGANLLGLDVQPVAGDGLAAAGGRLLRRVVARHRTIAQLRYWPAPQLEMPPPEFIAGCLPAASISPLPRHAWS